MKKQPIRDVKMSGATLPMPGPFDPFKDVFRIPKLPKFENPLKKLPKEKEMTKTIKVVLIRHGESTWNASNTFTGWTDIPLSDVGEHDAR